MIDMHSHVLPGIDDGAKDIEDAISMLKDSYEKGCSVVVATPHLKVYSEEELMAALNSRDKAYDLLMKEAEKRNCIIPDIKKGFEVHLDKDITEFQSFRNLCIEGTSAMLVEMPMRHWDQFTFSRIESLKQNGITPIIAHVERYLEFKKNIEKALALEGVIYQVNSGAFLSWSGRRLVKKMHKAGKAIVAGSDMHNMTSRKNRLSEAYKKAIKSNKSFEIMFNADISAL